MCEWVSPVGVQGEVLLCVLMLRCSNLTSCCSLCVLAVAEVSRRRCSLGSPLHSGKKKEAADGLSSSVTLALRLTAKTATEKSNEKPPEPVKVSHGALRDFNVRIQTKKEVRGACRRRQRELLSRISTWERLA